MPLDAHLPLEWDEGDFSVKSHTLPLSVLLFIASLLSTSSASALTLSVSVDTPQPIVPGMSGILVSIRADEELAVGTTDITFNWDLPPGLQVDSLSSGLSGLAWNIENSEGRVQTASSAIGTDVIPLGDPVMTFSMTSLLAGTYSLFITDGDGISPDDLTGPVPPIPPTSIPYDSIGASLVVVPEPSTGALLLVSLAWLVRGRSDAGARGTGAASGATRANALV